MDQFGKECKSKTEFSAILKFEKLPSKFTQILEQLIVLSFPVSKTVVTKFLVFRTTCLKLRQSFLMPPKFVGKS